MEKVTKHTRAKKGGIVTVCPHCEKKGRTYHFAWYSKVCQGCGKKVIKTDWLIDEQVKVVFRRYRDGDIIALFPELSYSCSYMTESYLHIGQHGDADYQGVIAITKLASPEEYQDLKAELESIGYNLLIRQKASINYKR